MIRRAIWLASGAALCLSAPALAQDEATGEAAADAVDTTEAASEAAAAAVAKAVEAAAEEVESEASAEPAAPLPPAYIIAANDRFITEYAGDGWLRPDQEICLEEGEVVQIARRQPSDGAIERVSIELRGEMCTLVGEAEEAATIVLVTMEGGVGPNGPRAAVVRGTLPGGGAARRDVFRVASGSEAVLERFARGSTITRSSEVCLNSGEQITLISRRGQRVTYRGPGCARRSERPTPGNLGGFTFG